MGVINKIIGTHSERELKRHKHTLDKVLALKPEMEKLTDDEMRAKTPRSFAGMRSTAAPAGVHNFKCK